MRKGIFIPDITVEMFKNASLEAVEEFMTSGQMEDIEIPERIHGEWDYDARSGQFICSECEGGVNMPTLMGEPLYKWCPWCGADMRKEGDGE